MQIETDLQPRLMSTTHFSSDWQHSRVNTWNRTADRNVLITGLCVGVCWPVCSCISHRLLLNIEEATTWLALAGWQLNSSPSCFFPSHLLKWLKSCWPVRTGRVHVGVCWYISACLLIWMCKQDTVVCKNFKMFLADWPGGDRIPEKLENS